MPFSRSTYISELNQQKISTFLRIFGLLTARSVHMPTYGWRLKLSVKWSTRRHISGKRGELLPWILLNSITERIAITGLTTRE
jgi:hypothetical protein